MLASTLRRTAGSLLAAVLAAAGPAGASDKVDEVVFQNGDHLTGEIKKLNRGKLTFKTDPTDSISIEWTDVAGLTSPETLEVETSDGRRQLGHLEASGAPGSLRVVGADSAAVLSMLDVVRITPIKDRFLARIDGLLSLGFSYEQAAALTTLTFSASATYRVPKYLFGIDLSANSTNQESGDTSRENLSLRFQQFFKKRWFAGWNLTGESNSELGIDLRTVLSGTAGRNVIQTNAMILATGTGLSYNRERLFDETTGENEDRDSLEALVQVRWEVFHDRNPETDVVAELSIYPGITDWGRLRGALDVTLRHELFKDFFWQLHLRETYDNRPPSEEVSKGDLVGDTSFGWSF